MRGGAGGSRVTPTYGANMFRAAFAGAVTRPGAIDFQQDFLNATPAAAAFDPGALAVQEAAASPFAAAGSRSATDGRQRGPDEAATPGVQSSLSVAVGEIEAAGKRGDGAAVDGIIRRNVDGQDGAGSAGAASSVAGRDGKGIGAAQVVSAVQDRSRAPQYHREAVDEVVKAGAAARARNDAAGVREAESAGANVLEAIDRFASSERTLFRAEAAGGVTKGPSAVAEMMAKAAKTAVNKSMPVEDRVAEVSRLTSGIRSYFAPGGILSADGSVRVPVEDLRRLEAYYAAVARDPSATSVQDGAFVEGAKGAYRLTGIPVAPVMPGAGVQDASVSGGASLAGDDAEAAREAAYTAFAANPSWLNGARQIFTYKRGREGLRAALQSSAAFAGRSLLQATRDMLRGGAVVDPSQAPVVADQAARVMDLSATDASAALKEFRRLAASYGKMTGKSHAVGMLADLEGAAAGDPLWRHYTAALAFEAERLRGSSGGVVEARGRAELREFASSVRRGNGRASTLAGELAGELSPRGPLGRVFIDGAVYDAVAATAGGRDYLVLYADGSSRPSFARAL